MTEESLAALKKNGRRKLILPRPRLVSVIALIESIQHANTKERREALQRFDEDLSKAVSKDMSTYIGEVMSSVSKTKQYALRVAQKKWILHLLLPY